MLKHLLKLGPQGKNKGGAAQEAKGSPRDTPPREPRGPTEKGRQQQRRRAPGERPGDGHAGRSDPARPDPEGAEKAPAVKASNSEGSLPCSADGGRNEAGGSPPARGATARPNERHQEAESPTQRQHSPSPREARAGGSPEKEKGRSPREAAAASSQPQPSGKAVQGEANLARRFSLEEIRGATQDFTCKLGEGGFGAVFWGQMSLEGEGAVEVAVKILDSESFQGFKEWETEIRLLGKLRHPHLVRLYGYAYRGSELMLVYQFMPNRSFDYHLFPVEEGGPTVSFQTRLKVLVGAAEGLQYLHQGSGQRIIYRDFKTSNILLDKDWNAMLCDFGLAREGPDGSKTHVSTGVVGTSDYIAPEYIARGHVSERCDVYSFGVVMLEVLTGFTASECPEEGGPQMAEWALARAGRNGEGWERVLDKSLRGDCCAKAARFLLAAAVMCLEEDPTARPPMVKVMEGLRLAYNLEHADSLQRQRRAAASGLT